MVNTQPVERLASARHQHLCVPPADTVETAEAWELALTARETPSVLSLTRQGLTVRTEHKNANLSAKGGLCLAKFRRQASGDPDRNRIRSVHRPKSARGIASPGMARVV